MKLRNNTSGEDAWFVHNPDEATKPLLANCGHLNTEIKRRVLFNTPPFPSMLFKRTVWSFEKG
ncbi:hypothetical protein LE134_02095 [Escherichia coli]|uniref:DUF7828 domain-containing protein n=1 Tax=Escherichia coli TaxID=562 RepID=UPI0037540871|nr:hypothetical protein [Escherichia coli]